MISQKREHKVQKTCMNSRIFSTPPFPVAGREFCTRDWRKSKTLRGARKCSALARRLAGCSCCEGRENPNLRDWHKSKSLGCTRVQHPSEAPRYGSTHRYIKQITVQEDINTHTVQLTFNSVQCTNTPRHAYDLGKVMCRYVECELKACETQTRHASRQASNTTCTQASNDT